MHGSQPLTWSRMQNPVRGLLTDRTLGSTERESATSADFEPAQRAVEVAEYLDLLPGAFA